MVSYAVFSSTYRIAIDDLRQHEIVDLSDETRKNADGLKAILTQLREDLLTLSQHPKLQDLVSGNATGDESLRLELGEVFVDICKSHTQNAPVKADVPRWKHFMQVRYVDADGHERIRAERDSNKLPADPNRMTTVDLAELDVEAQKGKASRHFKGEESYFENTRAIYLNMRGGAGGPQSEPQSLRVHMSEIGFNKEADATSSMHNVLTIRAAVPLTRIVDRQLEFRGILIINLDFESAIKSLTDAARHLVHIGAGEANASSNPSPPDGGPGAPRLLYNPEYHTVQHPRGRSGQNVPPQAEGFKAVLHRHIQDCTDFSDELGRMFAGEPERSEWSRSGNASILPLEDRGERFPRHSLKGRRLTLNTQYQFYLTKLEIIHPARGGDEAAVFYTELSRYLQGIQSDSVRTNSLVNEKSNVISMRATHRRELAAIVKKMEAKWKGRVKRLYKKPVRCANFAAHYYRIYFDPSRPQRYLALLVGFSDEELRADLSHTRNAAFRAFFIATLVGGTLFLLFLWWFVTGPINQLTSASEQIACGEYETELPIKKRDEIGRLSRTFAIMVNEVRARDEEIRRQNEDLDEKVRVRTANLAETRDQLEAAVKARDAFVATVSHELRTPMNHISGYAQLLESTDLDEEQRSDLQKLQSSARHLLRLVQDILDYQKIIMGRLPVSPVRFGIMELLNSVRESNEPKAAQRENRLVLKTTDLEGDVFNDENRLRQILDNLVGNACKFTTNGTITIDARTEGVFIDVAVTDTGVGIGEAGLEKLFKPFSKVSDGNLNPDGTGLGLVISQQLARNMGGDITVTSVPKEGSTFLTRILRELPRDGSDAPFAVRADVVSSIVELQKKSPPVESTRKASNQVLVIDDDPKVRELITRFLTDEKLSVITASTGAEGIEMAGRHAPSVITLDLVMPDVDGWSVLAALKANERTANIPVVLVTVLDDPQRGYTFGATDYIAKPIDGNRLAAVVRRYCGVEAPSVLIIDDNPKDREIVRRVLQNDGCQVIEAADGAEGLAIFEATPTDLIVLDLMMPVMDGFSFVDKIRQRKGTEMPPIVVLTAKEMTPANCDRLSGMVTEVIQKGQFDRGRFLQEIHRHLRGPSDPS